MRPRTPAAPSSANQQERYRRILEVAVEIGSVTPFEQVQMQDVAVKADVAIATLYRYFPSKAHLYVGVMRAQVDQAASDARLADAETGSADAVAKMLLSLTARLHQNKTLSISMMQSIILSEGDNTRNSAEIHDRFLELICQVAGWADPDEDQRRRAWLVVQCWFGVLMTTLTGKRTAKSAVADVRRACDLLLG